MAADGAIAHLSTARQRRSIVALCAGRSVACGKDCSATLPVVVDRARRRLSVRRTSRRTARLRAEKGEQKQAIGRSRGGRNTKIHAIADAKGRLLSILLSCGEAHDCPPALRLIRRTKAAGKLLGDKAYDSAELRRWLKARGIKAVVPNRSNRKQPFSFDKRSYKQRHRIENAFCRLKDFRRIATRYDRLARNFLASICLVAAIVWWSL